MAAPIEMLESWYHAQGWVHERLGDDEIVATTKGAWGEYELRAVWRDDEHVLQFLAFPDIRAIEGKHGALCETINLINEQLWIGHFELWSSDSMIIFRHALLLENMDQGALSLDQAETLVEAAVGELDRFYPVFQFVLWGDKSPQEALVAAMVETHGEA
jgi:hypothetical protein